MLREALHRGRGPGAARPAQRYLAAVLAVAVAAALHAGFLGVPGTPEAYIVFYPAVIIAALYGGLAPGLFATLLSAFGAAVRWDEGIGRLSMAYSADWPALAVYLFSCFAISWIAGAMRRAQGRADAAEAQTRLDAETRRANKALREAHNRLNLHVENSPLAVVEWDGEFRITRWAGEAGKVFGWTAEEAIGKRLDELPFVYDEDRPSVNRVIADLLSGKLSSRVSKNRNVRKDGSVIHCEWYNTAIRDASGRLLSVLSQVLDVTDRNRLLETLRRYELVSENSRDIVLYLRRDDGRILEANAAAAAAYGYSREELKQLSIYDLRAPETRDAITAQMAAADSASMLFETVHRRKDGSVFPVEVSSQGATIGGVRTLIGVVRDITERRKMEAALRENEERLRLFVEYAPAAVSMFDREMRYIAVSRRWLSDYRLGEQDVVGRSHYDVFPEMPARWREIHQRCLHGAVERCEEDPFPRPDGTTDWVRWEIHPWRNAHGEVGGIIMFTEVITSRKLAEEELYRQREWLRVTLTSIGDAVLAVNDAGRITFLNPVAASLTGWKEEDALGQPARDVFHIINEQTREAAEDVIAGALQRGRSITLANNSTLVSREGKELPIEDSAAPIKDDSGRLVGAVVVFHDVSERRRAESRLRETQRLESIALLAGGIAHDFNNLLVGVIGNATLARDMAAPNQPVVGLLDAIIASGEHAAHLTRQMLAYSGRGRFVAERLNISEVVKQTCAMVQASIPKKVSLRLELQANLPPVEADRGQMQQVFSNLALNAAEAIGPAAGQVTVETGVRNVDEQYLATQPDVAGLRPGKYVYLEVRDTGCGMDRQTQASIFEPFFSTKFTGRGLGLAAVAGIVRGHKGAIRVSSEPGKGSCFTVLFPALEEEAVVPSPAALEIAPRGSGTVLVVDDEPMVRRMAKMTLERHGYEVIEAGDGRSAVDVFKRHPGEIAAVLLDLSMPEMGGDEALPELHKIRPAVKIVITSGFTESEARNHFQSRRVAGFLQKPYTAMQLLAKIGSALG